MRADYLGIKNMKKTLLRTFAKTTLILLALVLGTAALLSCSREKGRELDSVDAVYSYFEENAESLAALESVDGDTLKSVMGIDMSKIGSFRFGVAADKTLADELAVFELNDASYEEELVRLLEAWLARAARSARDYSPAQYAIILKAKVVAKYGYVFYAVCSDTDTLTEKALVSLEK